MFEARTLVGALLLSASLVQAARAEINADRVWGDWQAQAASFGLELKGDALRDGNVLRVSGAALGSGGIEWLQADEIVMTEGAADVSVTFGAGLKSTIAGDPANTFDVTMTSPDLALTVTEAGEGLAYAYAATEVKADYATQTTIPGPEGEPPIVTKSAGNFTVGGLNGQVAPSADIAGGRDFAVAMKTFAYDTLDTVEGNEYARMNAVSDSVTEDLVMQGQITLPPANPLSAMSTPADFAAAVEAGLGLTLSGSQGKSTGSNKSEAAFLDFGFEMVSTEGTFDLALDKQAFTVRSESGAVGFTVTSTMMPIPAGKVDAAGATMHLVAPLASLETPQDFTVNFNIRDVVIGDEIWGMIDPGAALQRTPANILIDATGKVIWQPFALLAAETTGAMVPPPQVTEVKLNNLRLAAAGAEVTGKGLINIDWSTVTDTGGEPMPLGTLDFTLNGAYALIDGIVTTGLVPEEQAGMARMMLGLYATPAAGEDALTSKVEFRDDGGTYVNGQRVQ